MLETDYRKHTPPVQRGRARPGAARVPSWQVPRRRRKRPTEAPEKTETDDLDEEIKRIIREVPDPTPQPGGE